MSETRLPVTVDVGGTFTDFVIHDTRTGSPSAVDASATAELRRARA